MGKVIRKPKVEVDMQQLLHAVYRKLWVVCLVGALGAMLSFMITHLFIPEQYSSYTVYFVNNATKFGDHLYFRITDISGAKKLVDSYSVILLTAETLEEVIEIADVDMDYSELRRMLTVELMGDTITFRVIATSTDYDEACRLATAIESILPQKISNIIKNSTVEVLEPARYTTARVGPDYVRNTMIGFAAGAVLVVLVIAMQLISDLRVTREDDIAKNCPYPILTAVPDMWRIPSGGYYAYGDKKKTLKQQVNNIFKPELVGSEISFAATEAYKLLRTKLQFSFADDKQCRVIGVSSAMAGEGKSLTSVNLAYSLAQLDKKILLIDCDMRRPSVSGKLPVAQEPGLSNYLTGQNQLEELIQPCGLPGEESCFHVLAAGPIPLNPVELLKSNRTQRMLEFLMQSYDYVILDLPPVGEVSDALTITEMMDGILMVIRQNYCNKNMLRMAVRQFGFMESQVLGVVYNCASAGNGLYRKQYYKQVKYAYSYHKTRKSNTIE